MTQPAVDTITVYPSGLKVKVVPNEASQAWPSHLPLPALVGVFEWLDKRDGSYEPRIRLHPKMIRMRATITDELGLGITYNSLRRLMTAGFVRSMQITPGQYAFDLQSYYQHVAKVVSDPEFWTGANLRRYMEAIG